MDAAAGEKQRKKEKKKLIKKPAHQRYLVSTDIIHRGVILLPESSWRRIVIILQYSYKRQGWQIIEYADLIYKDVLFVPFLVRI